MPMSGAIVAMPNHPPQLPYRRRVNIPMLIGVRIRGLRTDRGWTIAELAARAQWSPRYLAELERGEANPSIVRLGEVCEALGISLAALVAGSGPVADAADALAALQPVEREALLRQVRAPSKIALVGLRGAGKSAVGAALAASLAVPFVEVDATIEERAGMRLGQIFEFHGAARYRELEQEALASLLSRPGPMVLATGGSVVTAPDSWAMLRRDARTIWLRASPATHLARVEAQGDFRPMHGRENALTELVAILTGREPLYAEASAQIDTERLSVAEVVACIRGEGE